MLNYSLTSQELAELKKEHRLCEKRKHADRIKSVYLLGSGWSVSEVAEALLMDDDAIRRYFSSYKTYGVKGLLSSKYFGRMPFLAKKEIELLESHLQEHTYSMVSEIIEYVSKEFDVDYTDSGMRRVLKQLDFVYKKPEKIPYKVDLVAQKKFINQYKKIRKSLGKEDHIYFMDATHPEHTAIPGHGWIKRGETKVLKSNPRPYRVNINGAINISTLEVTTRFEGKVNVESTIDLLSELRKKQPKGWIYLFCDNAGYYQSLDVQIFAKGLGIKLIYIPAYSPNLNLIERLWKFFKKKILYNKHYTEFSDMLSASKIFFKRIGKYRDELQSLMTENFQLIRA